MGIFFCCLDSDELLLGLLLALVLAMAFFIMCLPPPSRRVAVYHCS